MAINLRAVVRQCKSAFNQSLEEHTYAEDIHPSSSGEEDGAASLNRPASLQLRSDRLAQYRFDRMYIRHLI